MLTSLYTHWQVSQRVKKNRKIKQKDMQTTMNQPTLNANQLINRISQRLWYVQELRHICIANGCDTHTHKMWWTNTEKKKKTNRNQLIFMCLINCWNSEIYMNQRLFARAIPFALLSTLECYTWFTAWKCVFCKQYWSWKWLWFFRIRIMHWYRQA